MGRYPEICRLAQDLPQVLPCIDFAHLYARSIGRLNSQHDFKQILAHVEKQLGKETLSNMHIHLSGIFHGPKGERHHLVLKESEFNYLAVLKSLKEFNCKGVVICESPNIESDALEMKKTFQNI